MPTHDIRSLARQLERLFASYPALPFLDAVEEPEPVPLYTPRGLAHHWFRVPPSTRSSHPVASAR